ncbi:MAG: pantetheine-phosphate adenylyltransferase [Proteobacteria bacterium]|nr:pantetheine-phosphate adenylyltransferase [Pseudomonadota bacterium]
MADPTGKRSVALFPASFDPVTNGHLDLIERTLHVFDEVVVAVATNVAKSGTFSVEERIDLLNQVLADEPRARVTSFSGLLVHYAREIGASAIIRGLRAMSDFENEFEMALMNKHLWPEIEIFFLMANQRFLYVSSSRLKELVRFGGNIDDFVPSLVGERLRKKLEGK